MARTSNIDVQIRLRNARKFQRDVKTAGAELEAMGFRGAGALSRFAAQSQRLKSVGSSLTRNLTLPLAAVGAGAIKTSMDFDAAMTQSLAIVDNVTPQIRERMEQTARDVALTSSFSAVEAAESYYFLASAGMDAEQQIAAMPAVARFAQAGMFDMAQATDILTDAQSALGKSVDDPQKNLENMVELSDQLVGSATLANASVEQFGTALTEKAGTAMAQLNVKTADGMALLANFADQGIKGQRAGTILTRTIEGLTDGAEKNADAFEKLGLKVFDAEGQLRSPVQVIGEMSRAMEDMSTKQKLTMLNQMGFNRQARAGVLASLSGADAIAEYATEIRDMGGKTQAVADEQLESLTEQLNLAKDNFFDLGIEIGDRFAPVIVWVSEKLTGLSRIFRAMPDWMQTGALAFGGFLTVLGPTLWMLGAMAGAVGQVLFFLPGLISSIGVFASAMAAGQGATTALNMALNGTKLAILTNPMFWLVAGIVAAVVALVVLEKKFGILSTILGWIKDAGAAAFDWLEDIGVIGAIVGAFNEVKAALGDAFNWIKTAFGNVVGFISDHWEVLLLFLMGPIGAIILAIVKNFGAVKDAAEWAFNAVKDVAEFVLGAIIDYFSAVYLPIITTGFGVIKKVVPPVWNFVKDVVTNVIGGLVNYFNKVFLPVAKILSWPFVQGAKIIGKIWPAVEKFLEDPIGNAVRFIIGNFGKVIAFIRGLPGKIANAASGMWDGLKNAFKSAINWIIRGWNSLEFKVPEIDLPGPLGKVGGFSLGTPNIPLLGDGGNVLRGGSAIVAERGPELLEVADNGETRVTPLTNQAQGISGALADAVREVIIRNEIHLDGKQLATSVTRHVENAGARA